MLKIIVTGSIGSGKSTVMECIANSPLFFEKNVKFISYDEIVNELYTSDIFVAELEKLFGWKTKEDVRKGIVSSTSEVKVHFNKFVSDVMGDIIGDIALSQQNVVLEYPLFFEALIGGINNICSPVTALVRENFKVINVCISDKEERIRRIKERCARIQPSWDDALINEIIKSQLADEFKCSLSDAVIFNDIQKNHIEKLQKDVDVVVDSFCSDIPSLYDVVRSIAPLTTISPHIFRAVEFTHLDVDREYHDIEHIEEMINILGESEYPHKGSASLILAILFHDFCYDINSSENEEHSAKCMREYVKIFNKEIYEEQSIVVDMAEVMILATKNHELPVGNEKYESILMEHEGFDEMVRTFLDLDVIRFTVENDEILEMFDDAIKQEYIEIDKKLFVHGRLNVLKSFNDRIRIFTSNEFGSMENNKIAHKNLKYLIAKYERENKRLQSSKILKMPGR